MTKCSSEFLSLADDCLRQFAMTGNAVFVNIVVASSHAVFFS